MNNRVALAVDASEVDGVLQIVNAKALKVEGEITALGGGVLKSERALRIEAAVESAQLHSARVLRQATCQQTQLRRIGNVLIGPEAIRCHCRNA